MRDVKRACKLCIHCKRSSGAIHQCRYHPPKQSGFPQVRSFDWCRCFYPDKEAVARYEENVAKAKARLEEARKAQERKG